VNNNLALSEVVILWGIDESADFISEDLKSKVTIVIDSEETSLSKSSNLHVKIKEQGDIFLALMLSRFLFISDMIDVDFLDKHASDYEDYHELTQELRIVLTLSKIGIDTLVIKNILDLIADKKVIIICGDRLNSNEELDDIKSSIDGLGMLLGLFDKEGCGVFYQDDKEYKSNVELKNKRFEFLEEIDTDILKEI